MAHDAFLGEKKKNRSARKIFLFIILLLAVGVVVWLLVRPQGTAPEQLILEPASCDYTPGEPGAKEPPMSKTQFSLDQFNDRLVSGGPPKDGIPSIDEPKFVDAGQADKFLDDVDPVFVVEAEEGVKVYPQKVLVWHEIVNDTIDGESSSVTYCPLTGTAIGFRAHVDNADTTLGVSGRLVNSNLTMYDRETDSLWPQVLGTAVNGPQKGEALETFPVAWSKWGLVKERFENMQVLSRDTGFVRAYGNDPYGSYAKKDTYYDSGRPFFPIMNEDDRLGPKEVVIGVINNNAYLALSKSQVRSERVVNTTVGDMPIVAVHDCGLETVRVYSGVLDGEELTFSWEDGEVVDDRGRSWTLKGALKDGQKQLDWVTSFDAMWFAWSSFYPTTELYR